MEAIGLLFVMLIGLLIFVAISRWVFRINDIIKRLDIIISALKTGKVLEETKKAGS
ncbi:MAG: hypothetical protein PHI99_11550 [Syntrophales bacterium]|nr:hypothetical protein [Syntrophales bacterium]